MSILSPAAKVQFTDITGAPLVGGLLYTYAAGTTTPLATYTDSGSSSLNSNPVVLNARGEANVWLGASTYKFKLCDANNNEIWTVDNISAPTSSLSPSLSGNVVIDSSSSNPALRVTQTGTGAALLVEDSANPDATPVIIDATGRLGIGTTAPTQRLDLWAGVFQTTSFNGIPWSTFTSDTISTTIDVLQAGRSFKIYTQSVERVVVGDTYLYTTLPIYLAAGAPLYSYEAANKGYVDSLASTTTPPGVIAPFAGTTAPTGWLACQGQIVSQTTYAALYAAISTTWNTGGEGAGNFRLPDLRGMFVRGTGTNGSIGGAIGPAVGASQTDTYLNHSHAITDPTHAHDVGVIVGVNGGGSGAVPYPQSGSGTVVTSNANSTGISVNTSTTGGTETKPKNYGVLYIIKT